VHVASRLQPHAHTHRKCGQLRANAQTLLSQVYQSHIRVLHSFEGATEVSHLNTTSTAMSRDVIDNVCILHSLRSNTSISPPPHAARALHFYVA